MWSEFQWGVLPILEWEKGTSSDCCRRCIKPFSTIERWKHHCRFCGQLVCDLCSIPREAYAHVKEPSRACWSCSAVVRALQLEQFHFEEFFEYLDNLVDEDKPGYVHDSSTINSEDIGGVVTDGDESISDQSSAFHQKVILEEMGSPERTPPDPRRQFRNSQVVPATHTPTSTGSSPVAPTTARSRLASFYRAISFGSGQDIGESEKKRQRIVPIRSSPSSSSLQ
mmetsp:Transcript_128583/g.251833  ORF Transcript_128583/g.251833 Transcript_128583/m.251833 type:complete len:225 (+) Transcript_128583:110-784(+)